MTAAERQRRTRERRKAEGMVMVRAWVPAHLEDAVRAAIAQAVAEHQEPDA